MSRIFLAGLSGFALLAFTFTADGQGLKDRAALDKIAAQKLTAAVNDALAASRSQEPRAAKATLRDLLDRVDDSLVLSATQKADLTRKLNARIRVLDGAMRGRPAVQEGPIYRDPLSSKSRPPLGGSGASDVAQKWTKQGKDSLSVIGKTIAARAKGIQGINMDIEKAHVIPDRDIAFPADWKERSERKKKLFGPQLTEKEVKLLKTLNSVMSVKYDNEKFSGVIKHLQDKTGLTILVDMPSLTELNIDYDGALVSLDVQKASVRTILKKILGDQQLTYIIKEGAIQVMTPKKASEYTIVRSYNVTDLVMGDPQLSMIFGPFGAQQLRMQNAQMLINTIQQVIEPSYWQPNGPGAITYFDATKSILIRASAEMHYQLDTPGLFGGR